MVGKSTGHGAQSTRNRTILLHPSHASRLTTRPSAAIVRNAERANGAPGNASGAEELEKIAKSWVITIGPAISVRPYRLPIAPCRAPCSSAPALLDMRPLTDG